jgi:hypothetical protein
LISAAAATALLALTGCIDDAPPASPVAMPEASSTNATGMGLRGAVYQAEIPPPEPAPDPLPSPDIASLGPDDLVATASIAASIAAHPDFDIEMGFAPGDGAEALKTAMTEALARALPGGMKGRYRLRGDVAIATLETGDTRVSITWRLTGLNGALIGEVRQTGSASAWDIASHWGDFARSAVEPAAKGISDLIAPQNIGKVGHPGNAS